MKKNLLALAIFFFLLNPGLGWAQRAQPSPAPDPALAEPSPRPKMVLAETEYDAKLNPPGGTISHEFVVRNEGDDNLELEVVPGCGCTVINYDRSIAPGKSGVIIVNVDLYEAWAGRAVNKAVTVSSNDPDTPITRLIMRAQVDVKKPAAETAPTPELPAEPTAATK
jgi:hypothetical protein